MSFNERGIQGLTDGEVFHLFGKATESKRKNFVRKRCIKREAISKLLLEYYPDLRELVEFVSKLNKEWSTGMVTRGSNRLILAYSHYNLNPQQYDNRSELIPYITLSWLVGDWKRQIKLLIDKYGMDGRYYEFKITDKERIELSKRIDDVVCLECIGLFT